MNRIVIIGGMGPQAGVELHRRIIRRAQENGARRNDEFPEVVHLSVPVPDFIGSADSALALRRLKQSLASVPLRKSDRVAIACNTAHLLLPELEAATGVRGVSMIDVVANAVRSAGISRAGLLASPATVRTKLYENALAMREIECVVPPPKDQSRVEDIIRSIIAEDVSFADRTDLERIAKRLVRDGAEGIILGCTELPLVFSRLRTDTRIFDCLSLMSERLVDSRVKTGRIRYNIHEDEHLHEQR